ncbi:DUF4159 domain-containing protein [bacterium]|jgi:Domain of unknown function (DUF4159)|nr:DUF4159 domain-containing protein [bacterium]
MNARLMFIFAILVGFVLAMPNSNAYQAPEKLVDRVRVSIERGVQYLRDVEKGRGHWEIDAESNIRKGGWTSLAMLALLNCGVPPEDEMMKRGLEYLRGIPPAQTYTVGLQTMVYCLANQPQDRDRIQRNVDWLKSAKLKDGWSYGERAFGSGDNSNTQYALLGLHEAFLAGANVDRKILEDVRRYFIATQVPKDGGWTYRGGGLTTMTMTTAGLCNLLITGADLEVGRQKLRDDGVAELCGIYEENKPVADALRWVGNNFPGKLTIERARTAFQHPFYGLYGIERVGRLTGNRFIGGHDWYRLGCEFFVENQKADGRWDGEGRQFDHWPVVATSFSLLFLSKGRTPVLMTKIAYNRGDDWNNKRSDCKNLVAFVSKELFKGQPMAWQIFDSRSKAAEQEDQVKELVADLLQSPVAYINGHNRAPAGKERDIIKEYLNNGGFLFAEACCGRPEFDADFRMMCKEMFPDNPLVLLPDSHAVWLASGKFAVPPGEFPLWGIQQGCKTILMYSPKPISGYWEGNMSSMGRGASAFQLGANIIAYATGLEAPKPRLTEVEMFKGDLKSTVKRGFLRVAQIKHEGDWQPAPLAMRNLMADVRKSGLDVSLETIPLPLASDNVVDFRFIYMHGRSVFNFQKQQMNQLRFNLETGGVLFADACCGAKSFDTSFRAFMDQLWEDKKLKLQPIPLTDELFSHQLNGEALREVRCRREGVDGKPEAGFKNVAPLLEGIKLNNRWVVIYSRYDLGCALEKHKSTDCLGYDYDSALKLGKAAVFYSLKR